MSLVANRTVLNFVGDFFAPSTFNSSWTGDNRAAINSGTVMDIPWGQLETMQPRFT